MKLFYKKIENNKHKYYFLGKKVLSYKQSLPALVQAYDLLKYKDETSSSCVVLVNGPSLNSIFRDEKASKFIQDRPKVCVNSFPVSEEFTQLKPEYVVFADPAFWTKTENEALYNRISEIYKALEKVTWKITIFIGEKGKDWNHFSELANVNPFINFQYINLHSTSCKNLADSFAYYEKNLEMPSPQNVAVLSLFLGINMGYKEIYLLGANHDWHLNLKMGEDNKLYIKDTHFDNENVPYIPFFKEGSLEETFTAREIFHILYTLHKSYEELAAYANYREVKIYNSSNPSFIDAFERFNLFN